MNEIERDCTTCKYYSDFTGECRKGLADEFQANRCDTSECKEYEEDEFYKSLEEVHNE